MAQQFAGELSGAAQEHTRRIGEMLEITAKTIGELPGQIEAAGESFRALIEEGSKELATSFAAAGENLDASLQQSSASISGALRQVSDEVEAGGGIVRRELESAASDLKATMAAGVGLAKKSFCLRYMRSMPGAMEGVNRRLITGCLHHGCACRAVRDCSIGKVSLPSLAVGLRPNVNRAC
jgi:hypothetical protein